MKTQDTYTYALLGAEDGTKPMTNDNCVHYGYFTSLVKGIGFACDHIHGEWELFPRRVDIESARLVDGQWRAR